MLPNWRATGSAHLWNWPKPAIYRKAVSTSSCILTGTASRRRILLSRRRRLTTIEGHWPLLELLRVGTFAIPVASTRGGSFLGSNSSALPALPPSKLALLVLEALLTSYLVFLIAKD